MSYYYFYKYFVKPIKYIFGLDLFHQLLLL